MKATLIIVILALCATLAPSLRDALVFDRERILNGEIWRLLTCPLVHFGGRHLFYDLMAFAAGAVIMEREGCLRLVVMALIMTLTGSLAILMLRPDILVFGGLSGVATGCIFWAALHLRGDGGWTSVLAWTVITGITGKTLAEFYLGASLLPYPGGAGFEVMPLAHVAGIVVALAGSIWWSGKGYDVSLKTLSHQDGP